ncbi:class B sortase [Slackia heliotrinireducens]|uniref:class B sortase n=1 Tax=Slackia heliotrinireducens TaxID=84110 RepID=UPI003314D309
MNWSLPRRLVRGTIRLANWLVDGAVLAAVVMIVCFTAFAVLDNNRVADEADVQMFEQYRPEADNTVSFEELQAQNPDVLGWLTVYGTGIDYPLVQGKDNDVYINTNAAGEFALSGSLFLDWHNAPDFTDASTIIYGHHMENSLMFGDLDKYGDAEYMAQHCYGNLFYEGADHGVELLGYLQVDAYDNVVYSVTVGESPTVEEFLDYARDHATVWRADPDEGDRLLVLSTCGSGTNDRHVVIARICDQTFEDAFAEEEPDRVERLLSGTAEGLKLGAQIGVGLAVFLLTAWVVGGTGRRGKRKKNGKE